MRVGRKILFSVLPLVLLLAGSELAARVLAPLAPHVERPFEHNEIYWITDPDLRDREFAHREMGTSFKVSTDARGLRYPLVDLDKPPGTTRVVFLGCSTTFGWGVDDPFSFPALVAANLAQGGSQDVQVLNGGQPGYTSFQGLWLYENVVRAYRPDVVVFGYVVQDARKAAYTDRSQALLQADARFLKQQVLNRSRLYLALRQQVDLRRIQAKERADGGEEGVYRVPPEDYVANIRAMARKVQDDGGRMVLFGFPLEREGYTREHRRLLKIAAEELGLTLWDIQAEVEGLTRQATLYFPQDRGHANKEGNEAIARRVTSLLKTTVLGEQAP